MDLLGRIAQAKGNPRQGLVVCSALGNKLKLHAGHDLVPRPRDGRHPRRPPA
jgi:hypothetical protein